MSDTADRVKKIVVEHLGVDAEKVTEEASFIDDLGLLFEPVVIECPSLTKLVRIAAKRVAHQRKVKAATLLRLPDVRHLVDEEALARKWLGGKIVGPSLVGGMEVDIAGGCHDDPARLEGPPFAADHPDPAVIDSIPEYRAGEGYFSKGQGAGTDHRNAL